MSTKHMSPEKFDEKVFNAQLLPVSFCAPDNLQAHVKILIDELRPLNSRDPEFCYTCRCEHGITHWSFGYTDREIWEQADGITASFYDATCKALIPLDAPACTCPFNIGEE